MIYLIHPDIKLYKSFVINSKEARRKLGQETMFHFDARPQTYSDDWQPLGIEFASLSNSKKVKMPDITTRNGRLFLNQSAYDALHNMLDAHGEFLPITHKEIPYMGANADDGKKNKFNRREYRNIDDFAVRIDRGICKVINQR